MTIPDPEHLARSISDELKRLREDVTATMRQIEGKAAVVEDLEQIRRLLDRLPQLTTSTVERAIAQTAERNERAINSALTHIKDAEASLLQATRGTRRQRIARFLVIGMLGVVTGTIAGVWAYEKAYENGVIAPATLNESTKQSLDWALSDEGQYARRLLSMNSFLLDGDCPNRTFDAKSERETCAVWRVSP